MLLITLKPCRIVLIFTNCVFRRNIWILINIWIYPCIVCPLFRKKFSGIQNSWYSCYLIQTSVKNTEVMKYGILGNWFRQKMTFYQWRNYINQNFAYIWQNFTEFIWQFCDLHLAEFPLLTKVQVQYPVHTCWCAGS